MCMCVYVCIYVYTHIQSYVCVYVYIYKYVHMHYIYVLCMHTLYTHTFICRHSVSMERYVRTWRLEWPLCG